MTTYKYYKRATLHGDKEILLKWKCERNEFYTILEIIKSVPQRRTEYDGYAWKWFIPLNDKNIDLLKSLNFEIDNVIYNGLDSYHNNIDKLKFDPAKIKIDESKLSGFRPYQIDGVKFFIHKNGRCLNGDDMGLGKTVQVIGYIKIVWTPGEKILIVCPSSVKINWQREFKKWIPEIRTHIIYGKKIYDLPDVDVYIINYDILGKGIKQEYINKYGEKKHRIVLDNNSWFYKFLDFDYVFADEAQYVSNQKSTCTKSFVEIGNVVQKTSLLSGTPIKNRAVEFFTALHLIDPVLFPDRWSYQQQYCDPKYNGFGWEFKGLSNWEELHEKISTLMIRRKKSEVLTELPPVQRVPVFLDSDPIALKNYKKEYEAIAYWLLENGDNNKLATMDNMEKLKKFAYLCKRNAVIEWITNFIEFGEKLVVFTYHIDVLQDLLKSIKCKKVFIDGSVKAEDRQIAIDQFQNDADIKLFIGQIKAAGQGITLTAASNVVFVEFGWTPADHNQARDRVNRFGQTANSINEYYLIAIDTVEEKIVTLLNEKNVNLNRIIDGDDCNEFMESSILMDVVKGITA